MASGGPISWSGIWIGGGIGKRLRPIARPGSERGAYGSENRKECNGGDLGAYCYLQDGKHFTQPADKDGKTCVKNVPSTCIYKSGDVVPEGLTIPTGGASTEYHKAGSASVAGYIPSEKSIGIFKAEKNTTYEFVNSDATYKSYSMLGLGDSGGSGFVGMLQVGADYQISPWIIAGIAADYQFFGASSKISRAGDSFDMGEEGAFAVTGRLGVPFTNRLMGYGLFGYSWMYGSPNYREIVNVEPHAASGGIRVWRRKLQRICVRRRLGVGGDATHSRWHGIPPRQLRLEEVARKSLV